LKRSDKFTRHHISSNTQSTHHPVFISIGQPLSSTQTQSKIQINDDFRSLNESLPSVFRSDPMWHKLKSELKVYHRWLSIVFYYSPVFSRSMRVLSLFSGIVMMLFIQSLVYNIADPDDGSCEECENEKCCLSYQSTLNPNEARCYWSLSNMTVLEFESNISPQQDLQNQEGEGEGSCHFRPINEDMIRQVIVAIVSAVIGTPFSLLLHFIIDHILSRDKVESKCELFSKNKISSEMTLKRHLSLSRFRSGLSSRFVCDLEESCGGNVQEDLRNMLNELSEHHKYLRDGKDNEISFEEFNGQH